MHPHHMLVATAFWIAGSACGADPAGPEIDQPVPNSPGSVIAAASPGAGIHWSPAGDQLGFVSESNAGWIYETVSGTTRSVYTAGVGSVNNVHPSGAGFATYIRSSELEARRILRQAGGETTSLAEDGVVWDSPLRAGGKGLELAPNGILALFLTHPNRLFVSRDGVPPIVIGAGCDGIVAISPDGGRAICAVGLSGELSFVIFHLEVAAVEPLPLPADVQSRVLHVNWGPHGIQLLFGRPFLSEPLAVYDWGSGSTQVLVPAAVAPEGGPYFRDWSRDGRRVAYWTSRCVQSGGWFVCARRQWYLHVAEVATGERRRVAVHTVTSDVLGLPTAISPDGTRVAYIMGTTLHLVEVP